MLFFTLCVAPNINKILDRENASTLLRKIFPYNFIFGLLLSTLTLTFSVYVHAKTSIYLSAVLITFFLVNLKYIMPKINVISDIDKKKNAYSKKFKILHLYSVILYLISMLISLLGIILTY